MMWRRSTEHACAQTRCLYCLLLQSLNQEYDRLLAEKAACTAC
jgi:hypothetical protein